MTKTSCGAIFLAILLSILLSIFLLSGCHRATKGPSDETKKEPAPEPAPAKQEKGKEIKPSAPAATPAPAATAEPPVGPIASGATLLDPAVPKDAEMIQTRLVELGLYKGAIDGIWGKGSRAGLRAFKEQNSLKDPDKWDKETQTLLFGGSDQATRASGEPDEESIASGEVLLNPDDAKETRIIQKRLAELGLYKGPLDGIWGKGSRGGLKAFKEQNSLGPPDKWDKETQKALFRK